MPHVGMLELAAGVTLMVWALILALPVLRSRSRGGALLPVAILYVAAMGRTLTVATNLDHFHRVAAADTFDTGISRLTTTCLIGLSVLGVAGRWSPHRWLRPLVAYGAIVIPASALLYGGFDPRMFLLPGLAIAAASCWATPVDVIARHARIILDLIVIGSLVLWWANPGATTVVGIDSRRIIGTHQLAGLTAHPNELGFVAALAVILHLYHLRGLWPLWLAAAATALLLTQSRSSWLAAAVGVLIWSTHRLGKWKTRLLFLVVGWAAWSAYGQTVNASGLTGRSRVWTVAWSIFKANPVLGAGPKGLPDAVAGTPLEFGGQAHNQLLDTLAKTGLIGALFLLAFFALVFASSRRAALGGHSLPLSMVGALLTRALFESPVGIVPTFLIVLAVVAAKPEIETPATSTETRHVPHARSRPRVYTLRT